jgi:hypothetical protein
MIVGAASSHSGGGGSGGGTPSGSGMSWQFSVIATMV